MPSRAWLAPFSLMVAATTWGLIWYPYRLLEMAGISGSVSSLLTYCAGVIPLLFLIRRRWRAPPGQSGWMLAVALASGWTNLAYVLAVIDGEVMRVMLLFYLAPLWTVLFAWLILKEWVGRIGLVVIALSLAGAFVMLYRGAGLPLPANHAEWMALSAGLGFALSNVLTRKVREVPIEIRSLWVFFGVCFIAAVFVSLEPGAIATVPALEPSGWLIVAGIALALLLATFSVQYGLAHTPANRAVVILLSELVVAAISSRYWAGELMDRREWIGGAMIVAATLLSVRQKHD